MHVPQSCAKGTKGSGGAVKSDRPCWNWLLFAARLWFRENLVRWTERPCEPWVPANDEKQGRSCSPTRNLNSSWMEDSSHAWELRKENVLPIKRGRDVAHLNSVLECTSETSRENRLREQKAYVQGLAVSREAFSSLTLRCRCFNVCVWRDVVLQRI
jgi:hypothetical protein